MGEKNFPHPVDWKEGQKSSISTVPGKVQCATTPRNKIMEKKGIRYPEGKLLNKRGKLTDQKTSGPNKTKGTTY